MWVKITVDGQTIRLTKEEYLKMINEEPNEEFLEECKKVSKLFKKKECKNEH